MTMEYASIDRDAVNSVKMWFDIKKEWLSDPRAFDYFSPYLSEHFPFQFAPRITNDSKSARWTDAVVGEDAIPPSSYDDNVIWGGSESRALSIEATYVIDGSKVWSGKEIAKITHAAKAILYIAQIAQLTTQENAIEAPVVVIDRLYGAVQGPSTWRIDNVSVTYSDKMVRDGYNDGGGIGDSNRTPTNITRSNTTYADAVGNLIVSNGSPSFPDNSNLPPQPFMPSDGDAFYPLTTKIAFALKSYSGSGSKVTNYSALVRAVTNIHPRVDAVWY